MVAVARTGSGKEGWVGKGDGEEASGRNAAAEASPLHSLTCQAQKGLLGDGKGRVGGGVGWLTLFFGKSAGLDNFYGIFRIRSLIFVKSECQELALYELRFYITD